MEMKDFITNVKDCNSEFLDQLHDDVAPGENGK